MVTLLALVKPHVLLLAAEALKLQAYDPTYKTLIDPPYELAPNKLPPLFVLMALQLEQAESVTVTDTSPALVAPHELLLLLEVAPLKLQEYAPMYKTLKDPP